ncbi:MAG: imidazole glycerol phosphate synthase subunit HisH [Deltaproteobacteria bacterium]|nr:imidazole glycerol phosphate synthase subunit HisH [Deltaproteobacteria bacterium]
MIAIIDYKAGNLRSVKRALDHLGLPARITADPVEMRAAERVIFPGVGAARSAMESIANSGLAGVISEIVRRGVPFLGICLGAQIILSYSEEDDRTDCLDIIPGGALRFPEGPLKVPEMGWNNLKVCRDHPLFRSVDPRSQFYFVHSYYPQPRNDDAVVARTEYGITFPSVIGRGNVIATQFHPEKSGRCGLRFLREFCSWDGKDGTC